MRVGGGKGRERGTNALSKLHARMHMSKVGKSRFGTEERRARAKYTAIGVTMPPRAARQGSTALRTEASDPSRNSCLISRPTTKKKMAISPSLIHPRRDSAGDPMCGPTDCAQKASQGALVAGRFARVKEMNVAATSISPGTVPPSTTSASSSSQ
jgi:hypothetical protein